MPLSVVSWVNLSRLKLGAEILVRQGFLNLVLSIKALTIIKKERRE